MKRVFSTLLMSFMFLAVQAQIHTPVKWKIKLEDSGKPEKEIVFERVEFSFNRKNITMTDAGVVAGESDDQTAADSLSACAGYRFFIGFG
jgi:hypothetical protein